MSNSLIKIIGDDDIEVLKKLIKRDQLLTILNTEPPKNWVKTHPIAKGVKYLPIEKVELLLTRIFQEWYVEIKREGQIANSIYCTIRLNYKDPFSGQFVWQEGTGAVPIKTDKGESPANMSAIKNDAVMTGLPAAESFAIKDAAEKIGKLFGKDLNRKDVMIFEPSYDKEEARVKLKEKLNADN